MVVTKTLQQDVEEILKMAFTKPEIIESFTKAIAENICKKFEEKIITLNEEITKVNEKYNLLELKFNMLENNYQEIKKQHQQKLDNIEQYSRNKNLRIYGLAESQTENTEKVIIDYFQENLNINLIPNDIQRCRRIGVNKNNNSKPRPIFIQLSTYKKKWEIYGNKKMLKNKRVTIKEDLTKFQLKLYQEASEKFGLKNTWSIDGKIMVFANDKKQSYKEYQQYT